MHETIPAISRNWGHRHQTTVSFQMQLLAYLLRKIDANFKGITRLNPLDKKLLSEKSRSRGLLTRLTSEVWSDWEITEIQRNIDDWPMFDTRHWTSRSCVSSTNAVLAERSLDTQRIFAEQQVGDAEQHHQHQPRQLKHLIHCASYSPEIPVIFLTAIAF